MCHTPWVLLTSSFFCRKSAVVVTSKNTDIDCILIHTLDTLDLLKIKVFWNKDYDIIITVHYVINKVLSGDSNYIVDVVKWPKVGNSKISMREVIIASIL